MKFTLGHRFCILVTGYGVRFCHRHRTVTLSRRQYRNLHDVIRHPYHYYNLRSIPLGRDIWLQLKPFVKIDTILFTYAQWIRYKRGVHPQIMSFLYHVRSRTDDQYHARCELENRFTFATLKVYFQTPNSIIIFLTCS